MRTVLILIVGGVLASGGCGKSKEANLPARNEPAELQAVQAGGVAEQRGPKNDRLTDNREKAREDEFRTWRDTTGKFKVEAAFIDFRDGKVQLTKEDGSIVNVPVQKLSENDQKYVTQRTSTSVKQPPVVVHLASADERADCLAYADFITEYLDRQIAEEEFRRDDNVLGTPGMPTGRPLSRKATKTNLVTGETLHLDRSYAYGDDGTATVRDRSTTTHTNPNAKTYTYDLTEKLDYRDCEVSIRGFIRDSTGQRLDVERTWNRDIMEEPLKITHKLTTSHPGAKACRCDLTETRDYLGRTSRLVGTIAYSTGETLNLNRTYKYDENRAVIIITDNSSTSHKSANAKTYKYDLIEKHGDCRRKLTLEGTITDSNGGVMRVQRRWEYSPTNGSVTVVDQ